jgi:hypothetical protein
MSREGFEQIQISTIVKRITFPSVIDYVRFQLVATPMAVLLRDRDTDERETIIRTVAADSRSFLDSELLRDGHLSFPQEAHVALARQVQ